MINIVSTETGLRAVDPAKNEVELEIAEWEFGGEPRPIGRPVDETIAGRAREIRFPPATVCIESESCEKWKTFPVQAGTRYLSEENQLVQIEANITVFLRFRGRASITRENKGGTVVVSFDQRKALTIGFRTLVRKPDHSLTIPPTPEGLAEAITYSSGAFRTTTPDRSYLSMRRHPPIIELGESTEIPSEVEKDFQPVGIDLVVPSQLDYLFVAAPMAYYTQSSVRTEESCKNPFFEMPELNLEHHFSTLPRFEYEAAEMLYRVFMLDCLVRNAGPYGLELYEQNLLNNVDLDPNIVYHEPPFKRFARYLAVQFDSIRNGFPEWHLSTFIHPVHEQIKTLPYLLDRLSFVHLPKALPVSPDELIKFSLKDNLRSDFILTNTQNYSNLIKLPKTNSSKDGWIADGIPINGFKSSLAAYENKFKYFDNNDVKDILIVINDVSMAREESLVTEIYDARTEDLAIRIDVKRDLSKNELRCVFKTSTDHLHYIGHCDNHGLRCSDGHLSIKEIEESNVQTFFLNACASVRVGCGLIEKGSVAGVVTISSVVEDQATKVGTTLARLLINGFNMTKATEISRQRALIGQNYLVLGDGTHKLCQSEDLQATFTKVTERGTNFFDVEVWADDTVGPVYSSFLQKDETWYLEGNHLVFTVSDSELIDHLSVDEGPVLYDDEIYWTDEFIEKLTSG